MAAAIRNPKQQPSTAVNKLSSMEIQNAWRIEGVNSATMLSKVRSPLAFPNAPMTMFIVGRIRNSRANSRNGAMPSQFSA